MPNVFISYRQESQAHQRAVAKLADRLRVAGLPVVLDLDVKSGPDEGWTKWCEDRTAQSEAVLVVASPGWFEAYESKGQAEPGCGVAWEARILRNQLYASKGVNPRVRFVELPSADPGKYPDVLNDIHRFRPITKLADFDAMVAWLGERLGVPPAGPEKKGKVVYLAETLVDRDNLRVGLAEELRDRCWTVLPEADGDGDDYRAAVNRDLSRSVVFIQLLEPVRWKGADRDYVQYVEAKKVGLKCLRYRDPEIQRESVKDEQQRAFLFEDGHIRPAQYDEFKKEVFGALDEMWANQHVAPAAPAEAAGRAPAFMRVVLRAGAPKDRWKAVDRWLDDHRDIAVERVDDYELANNPLTNRHRARPCQAFLLLCDRETVENPAFSPAPPLRECLEIQLDLKDLTRCPAVGVLYWPPPPEDDAWPTFFSYRPINLYKLHGTDSKDCPPEFRAFLDVVRAVPV